mgnify:CR=1 FL=1
MENYNDKAKELLAKRLEDCSLQVDGVEADSKDYKDLTDRFANIYRLQIDERKAEMEADLKSKQLEADITNTNKSLELKQKEQLEATKRKFAGDIIEKGVTLVAWIGMSCLVMNFEKTGAIMSKAFPGVFPKIKI